MAGADRTIGQRWAHFERAAGLPRLAALADSVKKLLAQLAAVADLHQQGAEEQRAAYGFRGRTWTVMSLSRPSAVMLSRHRTLIDRGCRQQAPPRARPPQCRGRWVAWGPCSP